MKAEHRKELETNALADRLGRMVTSVKQGPQRGTAMYIVLGVIVAALVFFSVRWYQVSKRETTEAWTLFELLALQKLAEEYPQSKPTTAYELMLASNLLWENGIKKLGSPDQKGAFESIEKARTLYEAVAKQVEGDKILEPEVMYSLAQIEEVHAIKDRTHLDSALEMYQELAKKHPRSAHGQLAAARVEILSDEAKRSEVARVYQDMQTAMRFDLKN